MHPLRVSLCRCGVRMCGFRCQGAFACVPLRLPMWLCKRQCAVCECRCAIAGANGFCRCPLCRGGCHCASAGANVPLRLSVCRLGANIPLLVLMCLYGCQCAVAGADVRLHVPMCGCTCQCAVVRANTLQDRHGDDDRQISRIPEAPHDALTL